MGEKQLPRRTKRKAAIRSKHPKEPRAAKHPFAKRIVTMLQHCAFAQSRVGFAVYGFHTREQSSGTLVCFFCNFSFKQRKVRPFSFSKRIFEKIPSALFQRVMKKQAFSNRFFDREKSYIFLVRISAEILFLFRFCDIIGKIDF